MAYQLGVDLGTTYTAAAVARGGRVEIASLGDRAAAVPSALFMAEDGRVLVGESATRRRLSDPSRVAREFKRRLGDPTPVLVAGTPYSAEALMARLLRWVIDQVTEREGAPPELVAVTHPANWGPYKQELLAQALRLADVEQSTVLTEPEAAAISYAESERIEPGEVVAVYDLGGGTFDAAVLRRTATGFEILGKPEGVERLGGIDFDEAVFAHVAGSLDGAVEALDPEDAGAVAALSRLREECVSAKEALSADTDTAVPVLLPNRQTEVRLTRSEFETMVRPALEPTIGALRRALRSAGLETGDVKAVLLVGGSSRIPLVGQMVAAELGRPVAVDAHPKHAVALGAALAAAETVRVAAAAASAGEAGPADSAAAPVVATLAGAAAAGAATGASAAGAATGAGAPAANGGPAGPPPAGPPPTGKGSRAGRSNGRPSWRVVVGGAVAMLLGATVLISVIGGGAEAKGGEIFLESASDPGPDPFSASVAVDTPTTVATPSAQAPAASGRLVLVSTSGATPGLYGGTRNLTSCDAAQQVAFLAQHPDKAGAFASVLGIRPADIPAYVATLTPVLLRGDTRVTNNGFRNGVATPRQAVLQAGTAVLVDRYGIPRSKCACGNPLAPPKAVTTTPKYNGAAWPGFQPNRVQIVQPARTPVDSLVLVDPASGQPFARRAGTSGTADSDTTIPVSASPPGSSTTVSGPGGSVPTTVAAGAPQGGSAPPTGSAAPATSGTTARSSGTTRPPTVLGATVTALTTATTKPPGTSPPTSPPTSTPTTAGPTSTTAAPTTTSTAPKPPVDITSQGTASASSTYPGGAYPAHLAVDGDVTTSWFSSGGSGSTFTWTGPLGMITEVDAISNRKHPQFPTGFGFGQVIVRVLRSGSVVFQQTVALPGTPDPDVVVFPNVVGDMVTLAFTQPEAPDCGGFAELRVKRPG